MCNTNQIRHFLLLGGVSQNSWLPIGQERCMLQLSGRPHAKTFLDTYMAGCGEKSKRFLRFCFEEIFHDLSVTCRRHSPMSMQFSYCQPLSLNEALPAGLK